MLLVQVSPNPSPSPYNYSLTIVVLSQLWAAVLQQFLEQFEAPAKHQHKPWSFWKSGKYSKYSYKKLNQEQEQRMVHYTKQGKGITKPKSFASLFEDPSLKRRFTYLLQEQVSFPEPSLTYLRLMMLLQFLLPHTVCHPAPWLKSMMDTLGYWLSVVSVYIHAIKKVNLWPIDSFC